MLSSLYRLFEILTTPLVWVVLHILQPPTGAGDLPDASTTGQSCPENASIKRVLEEVQKKQRHLPPPKAVVSTKSESLQADRLSEPSTTEPTSQSNLQDITPSGSQSKDERQPREYSYLDAPKPPQVHYIIDASTLDDPLEELDGYDLLHVFYHCLHEQTGR
jgi:hypothetical protein